MTWLDVLVWTTVAANLTCVLVSLRSWHVAKKQDRELEHAWQRHIGDRR